MSYGQGEAPVLTLEEYAASDRPATVEQTLDSALIPDRPHDDTDVCRLTNRHVNRAASLEAIRKSAGKGLTNLRRQVLETLIPE